MEIDVRIDPSAKEPKVIIIAPAITPQVQEIIDILSPAEPLIIVGTKDGKSHILKPEDIIKVYSGDKKVFALCSDGEYTLKMRIWEIEQKLENKGFVRISNSEIVNLNMAKSFDLSLGVTIKVELECKNYAYVSRRYMGKIKKLLGI